MRDSVRSPACEHVDDATDAARNAVSKRPQGVIFDPLRRVDSNDLKLAVKAFAAALERQELALGLRRRARTDAAFNSFAEAVEALLCNAAAITLMRIDRPLAVPRSSDAMWSAQRYREPVFGQHFLDAVDVMAHPVVGLLKLVTRGYGSMGRKGQLSTYQPTARLFAEMPQALFRWDALIRLEDCEVLILKGRKDKQSGRAETIDYRETGRTKAMRNEVRRINRFLSTKPFWVEPKGDGSLGATKDAMPIDPTRRTVTRIFNEGSWYKGGRLFGAYYETMRRQDRHLLRIATKAHPEGEPVSNVDYGQLYPRLAYARARADPPEGDLYAFGPENWSRDGRKAVMNAMLLVESPLKNWPEGAAPLFPKGTRFKDVVAAVRAHHPKLAPLLDRGIGLTLMWIESQLLISVLARLRLADVVALPLFDSVLVARSEAERAKEAMLVAFENALASARASVSIKNA